MEVLGERPPHGPEVLTSEALAFLRELALRFSDPREELLRARGAAERSLLAGELPAFSSETRGIREASWKVARPPADLLDRRVEITGPTDRKMIINALNSGAQAFMADFEDSHAPLWPLTIRGQQNLMLAARGELTFTSPEGKAYRVRDRHATLMVRPRGLHLDEPGLRVDGRPIPAALFDLGLYAFLNARELRTRGTGTYLYLPKIQSAPEAMWWEDVLAFAESRLREPRGSFRATVLIETVPAVFRMQEILHALRPRVLGLNFGRWDYLFSFVKTLRGDRRFLLPERSRLTMDAPFLVAASRFLVETCHARGAQAIGGMAADIPVRDDAGLNEEALARVTADKVRERGQGYDGTWVAHPALVPVALAVFNEPPRTAGGHGGATTSAIREPHPLELLAAPEGGVGEPGVRANIDVALRYLEAWLRGTASVAIHHRMEDTATAEICRAQLWQWVHLEVPLRDGGQLSGDRFRSLLAEEAARVRREVGEAAWRAGAFDRATRLLGELVSDPEFEGFLPPRALRSLAYDPMRFRT